MKTGKPSVSRQGLPVIRTIAVCLGVPGRISGKEIEDLKRVGSWFSIRLVQGHGFNFMPPDEQW